MTIAEIKQAFHDQFPESQEPIIVSAPGRVNLIGEHTDYNDGFVLPMAIDAKIIMAGSLRNDNQVHLYSLNFNKPSRFNLNDITESKKTPWSNYIRGVCTMLLETTSLQGMNIVLHGDIPQGAGLSSSAALEIGTAVLVSKLHNLDSDPVELVKLAQRAENEFVGVQCGIMDQFISMLGAQDHVLFLDCRSLDYQLVPAPFAKLNASVVVINSAVKRGLVDSEYNLRRSQCNQALEKLQKALPSITALRDVKVDQLELINNLEADLAKRARHVVTENQRVIDAVAELKAGNLQKFGELMNQSHLSLKDDYEVSCPELDLLVELSQSIPGTYGSRMTGAGFGGCTVSLVDNDALQDFESKVLTEYQRRTKLEPQIFIYNPSQGAYTS